MGATIAYGGNPSGQTQEGNPFGPPTGSAHTRTSWHHSPQYSAPGKTVDRQTKTQNKTKQVEVPRKYVRAERVRLRVGGPRNEALKLDGRRRPDVSQVCQGCVGVMLATKTYCKSAHICINKCAHAGVSYVHTYLICVQTPSTGWHLMRLQLRPTRRLALMPITAVQTL